MPLKESVQDDVKNAMRARDKARLGVLRLLMAAIKQKEVDDRIELDDADVLGVLVSGRATSDTSVAELMVRNVATVVPHTSAGELTSIFERGEVAIVLDEEKRVEALLTKIDLINFLANRRVPE